MMYISPLKIEDNSILEELIKERNEYFEINCYEMKFPYAKWNISLTELRFYKKFIFTTSALLDTKINNYTEYYKNGGFIMINFLDKVFYIDVIIDEKTKEYIKNGGCFLIQKKNIDDNNNLNFANYFIKVNFIIEN